MQSSWRCRFILINSHSYFWYVLHLPLCKGGFLDCPICCTCAYMHRCTRVHACTHARMHTRTHAHAHTHTYTHTCTHRYKHTQAHAHANIHAHSDAHTRTGTYAQTCTCTQSMPRTRASYMQRTQLCAPNAGARRWCSSKRKCAEHSSLRSDSWKTALRLRSHPCASPPCHACARIVSPKPLVASGAPLPGAAAQGQSYPSTHPHQSLIHASWQGLSHCWAPGLKRRRGYQPASSCHLVCPRHW